MKKTILILTTVFGLAMTTQAQYFSTGAGNYRHGGGLFGRGLVDDEYYSGAFVNQQALLNGNSLPGIPGHDLEDNQPAPVGSGVLLLLGFGASYAVAKKHRKE